MDRARPDLPPDHPQNVPLHQWSDGWLKMTVAEETDARFLIAHDDEKRALGWPVTRQEMIDFLVRLNVVPTAAIREPGNG